MRGSTSTRPGIQAHPALGVSLLLLSALLLLPLLGAPPAEAQHRDGEGDITMAMVGDLIITRALMPYDEPEFLKLRDVIDGSTVGFGNMEMLLHEYGPDIIPSAQSGGTYMAGHPDLAKDLAWIGLDMLGLANNHTMDWGAGGMRSTQRALAAAGNQGCGLGRESGARQGARLPGDDGWPGGAHRRVIELLRAHEGGPPASRSARPAGARADALRDDLRGAGRCL